MPIQEIEELKNYLVEQMLPKRIYLFGSYANNTYTDESDMDFYVMMFDGVSDIAAETTKAYKAIRRVKKHPIDIIVGTESRFEARKDIPSVENEVYRKGVLLYEAGNENTESLTVKAIKNLMETLTLTAEEAMKALKMSDSDQQKYAKLL